MYWTASQQYDCLSIYENDEFCIPPRTITCSVCNKESSTDMALAVKEFRTKFNSLELNDS